MHKQRGGLSHELDSPVCHDGPRISIRVTLCGEVILISVDDYATADDESTTSFVCLALCIELNDRIFKGRAGNSTPVGGNVALRVLAIRF